MLLQEKKLKLVLEHFIYIYRRQKFRWRKRVTKNFIRLQIL